VSFVLQRLSLPGGELRLLQPSDAAELPDDGPVEWAPLVPYWSVLWRSGVAARGASWRTRGSTRCAWSSSAAGSECPSLVAARAGVDVLATDECAEALELIARKRAREPR